MPGHDESGQCAFEDTYPEDLKFTDGNEVPYESARHLAFHLRNSDINPSGDPDGANGAEVADAFESISERVRQTVLDRHPRGQEWQGKLAIAVVSIISRSPIGALLAASTLAELDVDVADATGTTTLAELAHQRHHH